MNFSQKNFNDKLPSGNINYKYLKILLNYVEKNISLNETVQNFSFQDPLNKVYQILDYRKK